MDGAFVLELLKAAWGWAGPVLATVAADVVSRRMRARRWRRSGCLN